MNLVLRRATPPHGRSAAILAAVATIALLVALQVARTTAHAAGIPTLTGVTPQQLASVGIKLGPPAGTPAITAEQAQQLAIKGYGRDILDTQLATCKGDAAGVGRLCYVVVNDASGDYATASGPMGLPGPPKPLRVQLRWEVTLVDAQTGKLILAADSS